MCSTSDPGVRAGLGVVCRSRSSKSSRSAIRGRTSRAGAWPPPAGPCSTRRLRSGRCRGCTSMPPPSWQRRRAGTGCARRDVQVHLGLGDLALEVDGGAEALDDEVGADLLGDVDDQLGEADDLDVVDMGERLLDHLLALVEIEERFALLRVAHRRDDHGVEEVGGCLDQLHVAVVDRVERARIQHLGHALTVPLDPVHLRNT